MVIAIVGIIFLSRLHDRSALGKPAAGWPPLEGGGTKFAAREVVHAQDQRDSQTTFPGAVTTPDSHQLCRRSGDGFRIPEGRRGRRTEMAGDRRMGRRAVSQRQWPRRGEKPSLESCPPSRTTRTSVTNCKPTSTSPYNSCGRSTARHIPDGYRYSRFCDLYRRWLRSQEVVLRQEHRAGEKLFVDFAGDTIPVHPAAAGE